MFTMVAFCYVKYQRRVGPVKKEIAVQEDAAQLSGTEQVGTSLNRNCCILLMVNIHHHCIACPKGMANDADEILQ
jgi:hypothetical protein